MRTYYRCRVCLAAFTTETPIPYKSGTFRLSAVCECEGELERMGIVCGPAYGKETIRCKCDERCTFASGPNCDCQCNGANHGSGMAGMEVGFREDGRAIYRPCDAKAKTRAAEFRAELARMEGIHSALLTKIHELVMVDRNLYTLAQLGSYRYKQAVAKARKSASHHHRMKVLREWATSVAEFFTDDGTR